MHSESRTSHSPSRVPPHGPLRWFLTHCDSGQTYAISASEQWGVPTLTAPTVVGYRFAGWSGDGPCVGSEPVLALTGLTSDVRCTATYVARRKVTGLAVGPEPAPAIIATSPDVFAVCAGNVCEVDAGGTVQLLAPSVHSYRVAEWSGE